MNLKEKIEQIARIFMEMEPNEYEGFELEEVMEEVAKQSEKCIEMVYKAYVLDRLH